MTQTATTANTRVPQGGEPIIEIDGLNKWFSDFHVLKDIDLSVNRGEVVVVIGPSETVKLCWGRVGHVSLPTLLERQYS